MFFTGEIKRRAALVLVCMMCDVRINADLCFMIQRVFREDPHLKKHYAAQCKSHTCSFRFSKPCLFRGGVSGTLDQ